MLAAPAIAMMPTAKALGIFDHNEALFEAKDGRTRANDATLFRS